MKKIIALLLAIAMLAAFAGGGNKAEAPAATTEAPTEAPTEAEKDYSGYTIRIYSRVLTAEEIARNYKIDKARFNLPD